METATISLSQQSGASTTPTARSRRKPSPSRPRQAAPLQMQAGSPHPDSCLEGATGLVDFPSGNIEALARSDRGLLVAIANQPVLLCSPQCAQLGPPPPGRVDAIGWLPDGKVWVMEEKGSLLVLEESGDNPGPWSTVVSDHPVDWSNSALLKNPWMHHLGGDQRPNSGGRAQHQPPPPGHPDAAPTPQSASGSEASSRFWTAAVVLGVVVLLGLLLWGRSRSRSHQSD